MRLPAPRTPHPQEAPGIRWGVLGPGSIARGFADAAAFGTQSRVVAVGSRDLDRARGFADKFAVPRAYGSYEALVDDPEIDAVYVATPHSAHYAHIKLALAAGKPVLCEKAFTENAEQAAEVLKTARAAGLLLAEAMWSRYLPHFDVISQVVAEGLLGELHLLSADHGQRLYPDGPQRLRDPALAGGALLDLGIYPLTLADHVCGPPNSIRANGFLTPEGVDRSVAVVLEHVQGPQAVLHTTMAAETACVAQLAGSVARLELAGMFYAPTEVRLIPAGCGSEAVDRLPADLPAGVRGMSYEIAEFARTLQAGELETPAMPHAVTLRMMNTMDEIRRQLGVRYPDE